MEAKLTLGAVYERTVAVSLERVWENVHDWEHLPFLHSSSFLGIELEAAGDWGWRARVRVPGQGGSDSLLIDLRREEGVDVYHTRTLEGPGKGADTRVKLTPRGETATDVRVEFWLPVANDEQARTLGRSLVTLYTQLWDEDESMMLGRQRAIDAASGAGAGPAPKDPAPFSLGPWETLGERLPLLVSTEWGEYRVVESEAGFVAHPALCPHRGGPLHEAAIEDDFLVCPWHGYRFSLVDGRAAAGRNCRMKPPLRVERGPGDAAQLVFDPGSRPRMRAEPAR